MDLVCLYIYYFIFFRANKGILFLICHHKNANAFFHVNRIIFKSLVNQISFFFFPKNLGHLSFPMDNTAKRIHLGLTTACILSFSSSAHINKRSELHPHH